MSSTTSSLSADEQDVWRVHVGVDGQGDRRAVAQGRDLGGVRRVRCDDLRPIAGEPDRDGPRVPSWRRRPGGSVAARSSWLIGRFRTSVISLGCTFGRPFPSSLLSSCRVTWAVGGQLRGGGSAPTQAEGAGRHSRPSLAGELDDPPGAEAVVRDAGSEGGDHQEADANREAARLQRRRSQKPVNVATMAASRMVPTASRNHGSTASAAGAGSTARPIPTSTTRRTPQTAAQRLG